MSTDISSMLPIDLDSMIRRVPVIDGALYQVPVAAGSVLRLLAQELFIAIEQVSVKELRITAQDIEEMFEYLLAARCAYVSGVVKLEVHPKDIQYPCVLFPILSAIGRYVDPDLNLTILPIPEIGYQGLSKVDEDDNTKIIYTKGARLTQPEKFQLVLSTFLAFGVAVGRGLPMDKDAPNDDLFRLQESEQCLVGGKKEPSSHVLYARAMLEMSYIAKVYGEARVTYLALASLRAGIYDLVQRQVRGPSRRLE